MKKILSFILVLCILFIPYGTAFAAAASGEIIVLYTNDVHCAVDDAIGYAGLAAYASEMRASAGESNVTLVDAGDAVQGAALGTLSGGKYLVDIMNEVGYDIVVPGNHEFDYGLDQMLALMELHDAAVVCSNFFDNRTGKTVFEPYRIVDYGNVQVAFIGITTTKTFTSSTPSSFKDDAGNYIYSFCEDTTGETLYNAVQQAVDSAIAAGADHVIAVGHCGVGDDVKPWQSIDIIANTTGIDAFIDAHSHSSIPGEIHKNKAGEDVVLSSTGSRLAAIGKLVITPEGRISTTLVTDYAQKDPDIASFIENIKAQNEVLLNTVVAKTEVPLVINDPATGKRIIRSSETNLGDFCADAYRTLLGADIAVVNGGGIRADIAAGDITYNDIISVHPYGNEACVVEATGNEILDMLEMGARSTPYESGGFLQVSGLSYEIHTYIGSSVKLDDKGNFVGVDGDYRVKNVLVGGEPLDLQKTYTLASHNYMLKDGGDGFSMFMDNKLLQDEVMLDNQVLITYIADHLGGVVGEEYKDVHGQGRIKVVPFSDVTPVSAYYAPVSHAYNHGITNGMTPATFDPDTALTQSMLVTMLYRLAGSHDVESDKAAWYSAAAVWASENGIIPAGEAFDPSAALNREEMAGYIYRYIQSTGGGFTGLWMFDLQYADKADICEEYYEAVAYLTMINVFSGSSFDPDATATRAMAVTAFYRLSSLAITNP